MARIFGSLAKYNKLFTHQITKNININIRSYHYSPLQELQEKFNPVLAPFGNYKLPMKFQGYVSKDVTINTRKPNHCTIFDVSQMAVIELSLRDFNAQRILLNHENNYISDMLERIFPVNTNILTQNKSVLSVVLNERCEIHDDFIIGNIDNQKYRFIVNANTQDKFMQLMKQNMEVLNSKYFWFPRNYKLELKKCEKIILAIQGPKSQSLLEKLFLKKLDTMYFMENRTIHYDKSKIEICRCGYTGEDGFELYLDLELGKKIYQQLLDLSVADETIMLGGLLERDILRLEAGLCLSGSEFGSEDNQIHFQDSNLNFIIGKKRRKNLGFIGDKNFLLEPSYQRVGFSSPRPVRPTEIYSSDDKEIGFITSGIKSYSLDKFIGMGYVKKDYVDKNLYFKNNNKNYEMELEELPFLENKYYRK